MTRRLMDVPGTGSGAHVVKTGLFVALR